MTRKLSFFVLVCLGAVEVLWAQNSTIIPPVSTVNNYTINTSNAPTFFVATNGVASGPGTFSSPWTLAYAMAHAGPSNVIMVLPGTNYPTLFFSTPSLHNGITLKSYAKWGAAIPGQTSVHCIEVGSTVSNVTIDGFEIRYSYIDGIKLDAGLGCTVQNCWVHDSGHGNPAWVTNGSGVFNGQGIHFEAAQNCTVRNNLIENNGATVFHDHGIYYSGTNNVVSGNVVRFNLAYGIQQFSSAGAINESMGNQVFNNLVYSNDTEFGEGQLCTTFYCSDQARNWTNYVFNNIFASIAGSAAEVVFANANGFLALTNNILVQNSGDCVTGNGGATIWADYNLAQNAINLTGGAVVGTHNVITNRFAFANPVKGLWWLLPTSAARGMALGGLVASNDFFGNYQRTNSDVGCFQFNTLLAGDARDLSSTSGADYWTFPTTYNSAGLVQGLAYQTLFFPWQGPTNTIDLAGPGLLEYSSFTACQLSGVINKPTGNYAVTITLKLNNLSATNWNLTLPTSMLTKDGSRSYAVGPGQDFILPVLYDPFSGHTNSTYVLNF